MDDIIPFKTCTKCGAEWDFQSDFLSDPNIVFIGYQPHFEDSELAFFLFNHRECGTTLNVRFASLKNLESGSLIQQSGHSCDIYGDYCFQLGGHGVCPRVCRCDSVKNIIRTIEEWHLVDHPDEIIEEGRLI